jgi:hypothetical protein
MATSGTKAFTLDVISTIEEAYDRIGGEMTTGYELKTARRSLSLLLTEWANEGINLWTIEAQNFPLTKGVAILSMPADCIDVLDVYLTRGTNDYPLDRKSRSDYLRITDKTTQSMPRCFYLDRQKTPMMYLWPVPDDSADVLKVHFLSHMEDVGRYTNNLDVPTRFLPALCSGLAWHLSFKRPGFDPNKRLELQERYDREFERAKAEDRERTSMFVRPRIF